MSLFSNKIIPRDSEVLGTGASTYRFRRGHVSILYTPMYTSLCSLIVIGCWIFLRSIEISHKEKNVPRAMNEWHSFPSWHFSEILGKVKLLWANPCKILYRSSFLLLPFSRDSFGSTRPSPDAFHVRWFKHVCARLCVGLCEANYSWKQLLSQQLGSSQSRITLL